MCKKFLKCLKSKKKIFTDIEEYNKEKRCIGEEKTYNFSKLCVDFLWEPDSETPTSTSGEPPGLELTI